MKGIVLSTFASAVMLLLLTFLPVHWAVCGHWRHRSDSPGLNLPEASASRMVCRDPGAAAYVSLHPTRGWVMVGSGFVSETRLGEEITRGAKASEQLGNRPYLHVRIPADLPARHFLQLHRIATEAGIEDFAFATWPTAH